MSDGTAPPRASRFGRDCYDVEAEALANSESSAEAMADGDNDVNVNVSVNSGNNGDDDRKIQVCHEGKTLEISASALIAHLEHGDTYGPCEAVEVTTDQAGQTAEEATGNEAQTTVTPSGE